MKRILGLSVLAMASSFAMAQSFNIDFDSPGTVFSPGPANAFGAAAGQAGFWNALASYTAMPLSDLAGNATGVTFNSNAGSQYSFDNAATTGDVQLLMDDVLDPGTGAQFNFAGLANGQYSVYTYGWAPDSNAYVTNVTINGNLQTVGGAFNGTTFVQGVTHALHSVNVTNGTLTIDIGVGASFASVNGIQLVQTPVPEPGTLVALSIGGLALLRFRRKR